MRLRQTGLVNPGQCTGSCLHPRRIIVECMSLLMTPETKATIRAYSRHHSIGCRPRVIDYANNRVWSKWATKCLMILPILQQPNPKHLNYWSLRHSLKGLPHFSGITPSSPSGDSCMPDIESGDRDLGFNPKFPGYGITLPMPSDTKIHKDSHQTVSCGQRQRCHQQVQEVAISSLSAWTLTCKDINIIISKAGLLDLKPKNFTLPLRHFVPQCQDILTVQYDGYTREKQAPLVNSVYSGNLSPKRYRSTPRLGVCNVKVNFERVC